MTHTVFYRWKVKGGKEQDFREAWAEVTEDGKRRCGAFGAKLMEVDDGTYAAIATWPDADSRARCWTGEAAQTEAAQRLAGCTEQKWEEVLMTVVEDR